MQRSHWYKLQAVCFEVSVGENLESHQQTMIAESCWTNQDICRPSSALHLGQSERQRPGGPSGESVRLKRLPHLRSCCKVCVEKSLRVVHQFHIWKTFSLLRHTHFKHPSRRCKYFIQHWNIFSHRIWHQKYKQIFAPFSMIVDDSVLTKISSLVLLQISFKFQFTLNFYFYN